MNNNCQKVKALPFINTNDKLKIRNSHLFLK